MFAIDCLYLMWIYKILLCVLLFVEKGGVLVETDHAHLFNDDVTPVGSLATGQLPEGAMVRILTINFVN